MPDSLYNINSLTAMNMNQPHLGHKLFLGGIGFVIVVFIAIMTYLGLDAYNNRSAGTVEELTAADNVGLVIRELLTTDEPVIGEDIIDDATVTDSTPTEEVSTPVALVGNALRGTVVEKIESGFKIILDQNEAGVYQELSVTVTPATSFSSVNTVAVSGGTPTNTVITSADVQIGDLLIIDTVETVTTDSTSITAAEVVRLQ